MKFVLSEQAKQGLTVYRDKHGAEAVLREISEFLRPENVQSTLDPAQVFTNPKDWDIPPLKSLADGLILWDAIHVLAGLFESYKTMAALEICDAIRSRRKVFDYFPVNLGPNEEPPEILYLCPDMPPSLFQDYSRGFALYGDPGFRAIDPRCDVFISVESDWLLKQIRGKLLVLDTMLDYALIKEAYQSNEWVEFFKKLRRLIQVHGCRGIILIAHPTKTGARNTVIDPTEFLKDSVTFGGKLDVGYAFRALDKSSKIFVQRIKGRGFRNKIKFTISPIDEDGNSTLDRGRFPIVDKPEDCKDLNEHITADVGGNPGDRKRDEKKQYIRSLIEKDRPTVADVVMKLDAKFSDKKHSPDTVKKWVNDIRKEIQKETAAKNELPFKRRLFL